MVCGVEFWVAEEVGSEPEVKKEPEKSPEEQEAEQQTNPSESAPNGDAEPQPAPDNAENAEAEPAPSDPLSTPSPDGQKKEKGISRFLPPWLKRQKSNSQAEPRDGHAPTDTPTQPPTQEELEDGQEEEGPKGEGTAVQPTGGAQEVQSGEEESPVANAETQPVKQKEGEEWAPESGVPSALKLGKKMKITVCHVTLLDGTQFPCEVEKRAKGQYLFSKVCEHLNLLEKDYFGLSFKDNTDQRCWLDPTKEIKHQIHNSQWQFAFSVKFYPPDPSQLTEDITRYLLCLQLRQDISLGRLPCSFVTHALLGSYTLQAELGDYDPDQHRSDYIAQFHFAPTQTKELEVKLAELHKSHKGMTPAQADIQFLENAKKLSMYGVDLHHAKDSEGVDIMLGVCANGLLIYKDRLRINRFAWPKILKISYKRCNFYIKIRPGETEQFESTVGFKLPNHRAAKRIWKVCVEHHTFFRLTSPEQPVKSKFLTLGSRFRYSGRTQAQTRQASALIHRSPPDFQRTSSKRSARSLDGAPVVSVSDHTHPLVSTHAAGPGENGRDSALELYSDSKSTEDDQSSGLNGQPEVIEVVEETVVIEEVVRVARPQSSAPETAATEPALEGKDEGSASSDSESEEEAEYHPQLSGSAHLIREDPEEEEQEVGLNQEAPPAALKPCIIREDVTDEAAATAANMAEPADAQQQEGEVLVIPEKAPNGHTHDSEAPPTLFDEEEEPSFVNGDVSHVEGEHAPQVICCSEPPVVKTEMVTISDTFSAQKAEITTKEVPIVHTETKTITYEAAQLDGSGDVEPGVLMTAHTITSESLCTTTTTHITKTLKGGLSETRIEKRIVITGDSDIDHDQALAQAIKEAKEQHPDMSVTRVVVHKETDLAEEDE
ncbi:band 4.1-like protein 2 isoform X15 [Electrophorus electricus]|uniref:band 4.1-like protein 2 isoform X15 n=1 Tax=Electrophorus electricus TaxID=8005 RepID=UPI0015D08895|nr:band 4.1-like protein 2 isoform X15 [Electrophorus electricus]